MVLWQTMEVARVLDGADVTGEQLGVLQHTVVRAGR